MRDRKNTNLPKRRILSPNSTKIKNFLKCCNWMKNKKQQYQSFSYENQCKCYKKLGSGLWSMLFTLTYFFPYTVFIYSKTKCCYNHCISQWIRPSNAVQSYISGNYFIVKIGFSMNNNLNTLPEVYTMLV